MDSIIFMGVIAKSILTCASTIFFFSFARSISERVGFQGHLVACLGLFPPLDDERSVLGSMFSFMRATKKARHNPESEGIYLDDLNLEELDPEVAALYFPRNFKVPEKPGYNSFSSGMTHLSK